MHENDGGQGPSGKAEAIEKRKKTTLKKTGHPDYYDDSWDPFFRWYPYLFLSKSKPAAHLTAMNRLKKKELKSAPEELDALLKRVQEKLS
jgi:hypothetical protein